MPWPYVVTAHRASRIAEEFQLDIVLLGNGEEWRRPSILPEGRFNLYLTILHLDQAMYECQTKSRPGAPFGIAALRKWRRDPGKIIRIHAGTGIPHLQDRPPAMHPRRQCDGVARRRIFDRIRDEIVPDPAHGSRISERQDFTDRAHTQIDIGLVRHDLRLPQHALTAGGDIHRRKIKLIRPRF